MVKHAELMNLREEEISKIIEQLSKQTDGFDKPKMILIGGYALRAFTSFSRYTRDCDFVAQEIGRLEPGQNTKDAIQGNER